jgi:hypothetical protein
VWHVIAANNAKQARQILQIAFDKTCTELNLHPPVLHQALARIITDPSSGAAPLDLTTFFKVFPYSMYFYKPKPTKKHVRPRWPHMTWSPTRARL